MQADCTDSDWVRDPTTVLTHAATREHRYASERSTDLHAQRTTMNTMLASEGVDSRIRQAQLRHTDPRLTEVTYFDKVRFVKPQAEALNQAAAIPGISDEPAAAPEAEETLLRAVNVQEIGVP